ncbi:MAG: PfaD family polyunsaturated fatty acid/polyketide biosynthesis protein [Gammaproteobacteria bacterium]|nr:PfaD family polyunsaturated fatty acid/polyketide biosynthesis protein [Gammaproteobacteria bacterium]
MSSTLSPPEPARTAPVSAETRQLGIWSGAAGDLNSAPSARLSVINSLDKTLYIVNDKGKHAFTNNGNAKLGVSPGKNETALLAYAPPLQPKRLGDAGFCGDHGIRLAYMSGAMANGIASVRLVRAIAEAGMLGSFGAAGLMLDEIEKAIIELKSSLGGTPFAANLIHSPNEKGQEEAVVDIYIRHGLQLVEASAYMALTPAVVRYRLHGIHRDEQGRVITPNRIIAKASRIEVAERWFSPAPAKIIRQLLDAGQITSEQAELAGSVPMAQDLTVEADSGGHTDNRPAITLIPTIIALRDRLQKKFNYQQGLRVGAAGGIATPASAAAAFAMGAAYIVTGTVNQACVESGSSDLVRQMLTEARQADVAMAPAVDMFEMGVKLQVLKRGTMFPMRGNKLYELYRTYDRIEDIPAAELASIEKSIFKAPMTEIWQNTLSFFLERDPEQVQKAEADAKHKMALMFRWYLGLSSRWANAGVADRQVDYQVWCGPAMGAFNEWTKGSFLETAENRSAVNVALNIMFGAALVTRLNMLKLQGVTLEADEIELRPKTDKELESLL